MSEDWSDTTTVLETVAARLAAFNAERDWEQFHTPKDLAICLSCEASEVMELFMWKAPDAPVELEALQQELADVLICTINLARRAGIDLMAAAQRKIALNGERYPPELSRGSAVKYDRLAGPTDHSDD